MMSKPPSLPPPPMKVQDYEDYESDGSSKTYLIIASAVFLGCLLAIILVPWLIVAPEIGTDGNTPDGGYPSVSASLDADDSSSSATESSATASNTFAKTSESDETIGTNIEPAHSTSNVAASETIEEKEADTVAKKEETGLLIVEPKRTAPFKAGSEARSPGLDDLGGANPFVGSGSPAKSTVYVIDVSASMQTEDRIPRVISTLKRAIELLKPDQKFQVVLFDDSFYLHPAERGLLLANSKNKKTIYDWLDRGIGGSGTNPTPAMLFAVQQKPERIVLLSDGEFDPTSEFVITRANKSTPKPAIIDCVGLMEEVETLKSIARSNKGIYYQAY